MKTWKVEPSYKKSLIERQRYHKDDKEIVEETCWRWGEFTITTEDDVAPVLEEGVDLYDCDYEVDLQYCDDGCYTEYEYSGFTDEEREKMEAWLEENSFYDLEEDGWLQGDTEMILACEPSIEEVVE